MRLENINKINVNNVNVNKINKHSFPFFCTRQIVK